MKRSYESPILTKLVALVDITAQPWISPFFVVPPGNGDGDGDGGGDGA